ncbi:universal stress protein [Streptomyces diastatochromogenes]|nr:universal stress protein [Streptomyces diastatochromogenes]
MGAERRGGPGRAAGGGPCAPEALQLGAARIASLGTEPELPDTVARAVRTVVEERGHRVPVRYDSLDGSVTDALPAAARGARLLVTGSRGHGGFASLLLGSTSRTLAMTAPCPLVVVPHEARAAALEDGAGRAGCCSGCIRRRPRTRWWPSPSRRRTTGACRWRW